MDRTLGWSGDRLLRIVSRDYDYTRACLQSVSPTGEELGSVGVAMVHAWQATGVVRFLGRYDGRAVATAPTPETVASFGADGTQEWMAQLPDLDAFEPPNWIQSTFGDHVLVNWRSPDDAGENTRYAVSFDREGEIAWTHPHLAVGARCDGLVIVRDPDSEVYSLLDPATGAAQDTFVLPENLAGPFLPESDFPEWLWPSPDGALYATYLGDQGPTLVRLE